MVDWDGLENRSRCKPTVGLNPTPSVRFETSLEQGGCAPACYLCPRNDELFELLSATISSLSQINIRPAWRNGRR